MSFLHRIRLLEVMIFAENIRAISGLLRAKRSGSNPTGRSTSTAFHAVDMPRWALTCADRMIHSLASARRGWINK